jgi:hypothetical protein
LAKKNQPHKAPMKALLLKTAALNSSTDEILAWWGTGVLVLDSLAVASGLV